MKMLVWKTGDLDYDEDDEMFTLEVLITVGNHITWEVFCFDKEEDAIDFARQVKGSMEPLEVNGDDEDG